MTIKRTISQSKVIVPELLLEIARGGIKGITNINKFGLNSALDVVEETIWEVGGVYPYQTSASVLDIVSTDANDTPAGTGANTMQIYGLDSSYNEIEETITLNGTTIVNTTKSYLRIYRMVILTAGSTGKAIGTITVSVGTSVKAQIVDGNNQTLMALYTIPAGKTGYLIFGKTGIGKAKEALIRFKTRPLGGVFNIQHAFYIFETNYDYNYKIPLQIPEKTDLMVTGQNTQGSVEVSAVFDIVLIDNE